MSRARLRAIALVALLAGGVVPALGGPEPRLVKVDPHALAASRSHDKGNDRGGHDKGGDRGGRDDRRGYDDRGRSSSSRSYNSGYKQGSSHDRSYGRDSHRYEPSRHGSYGYRSYSYGGFKSYSYRGNSGVSIHIGSSYPYSYGYKRPYGTSTYYCPPTVVRETHVYHSPRVYTYSLEPRYETRREVRTIVHDVSYASIDRAWEMLGLGDANGALRTFSALAEASPGKSLPKVGFALACADLGDEKGAVWAMRRAFEVDADAIHYFPRDERLQSLVERLEHRAIERVDHNPSNADDHFMIGALAFLRHDMERALTAVAHAEDYRDRSHSARELRRVSERWHPNRASEHTGSMYDR